MPDQEKINSPENVPSEKIIYRSLLNEGYWFDIGKKLVDNAEANINLSAEKFEKLILWFWGIYTSIVGLGAGGFTVFLGKSISVPTLIGLVLPSVVLLLAYWLTTAASTSVILKFEHRSPDSIREAFMHGLKEKGFFYNLARIFALIACFLIPITIFLANRVQSGEFEILQIEPINNSFNIIVSGNVPKESNFEIYIYSETKNYISKKYKTDSGHFTEKLFLENPEKKIKIRLWWNESNNLGFTKEKLIELP